LNKRVMPTCGFAASKASPQQPIDICCVPGTAHVLKVSQAYQTVIEFGKS